MTKYGECWDVLGSAPSTLDKHNEKFALALELATDTYHHEE